MYVLVFDKSDYDSIDYSLITYHTDETALQALANVGNALCKKLRTAVEQKDSAFRQALHDLPYPKSPSVLKGKAVKHLTAEELSILESHNREVADITQKHQLTIQSLEQQYITCDPELARQYARDPYGEGRYHVQRVSNDTLSLF